MSKPRVLEKMGYIIVSSFILFKNMITLLFKMTASYLISERFNKAITVSKRTNGGDRYFE